jgi:hypothetical protein
MLYIFSGVCSVLAMVCVDYVNPGFYNYDMCSKSYNDSQGHPNIYDRSNSQELIRACYDVTGLLLNPIIQFVTVYSLSLVTMRFMLLDSKKDFIKNNGIEIHSRFYQENQPTKPSVCPNCSSQLNGMAWCGKKQCEEFWREKFVQ